MKKIVDFIKELLVSVVIAGVLYLIISQFFILANISGESMAETYHDGQKVVLQKKFNDYKPEDVVAFSFTDAQNEYFNSLAEENQMASYAVDELHVKRIAGVAGDTIKIEDNVTYVNDVKISTSEVFLTDQEYVVQENELFVLGDNVNNSFDSRQHGPINTKDIYGEVMFAKENISKGF